MRKGIHNLYFEYLCDIVCDKYLKKEFNTVLALLHETEFYYSIELDGNRAADGIDLRSDFAECNGWDYREVRKELNLSSCTVLEMMVGLAKRIECGIMGDDRYGDRTGEWFWYMMRSMGMDELNDRNFMRTWDKNTFSKIVEHMLRRKYARDGCGGLFHVRGFRGDMREIEIWYQMQAYLDTIEDVEY